MRTLTCLSLITVIVASTLAAGCRSPRRRYQPQLGGAAVATTGGAQTVDTGDVVASGSPRERLEQLDGVLRQRGYSPLGPAVRGNLVENGLIAYPIDAQAGSCYTVAVIGEAEGQNINLMILDPFGRPASHDVRADNHPWASFCAGVGGRFIARLQMAAGSGGYYYAGYGGPSGQRMELSRFFGQEESGPQTVPLDHDMQRRFSALDQQLGGQGFSRGGEPTGLVLEQGQPRDFQLNLQQGQCYVFAALGGGSAQDVDLVLNDASGQRLGAFTDQTRDATMRFCAPATGVFSLQVRLARGNGPVFTTAYLQRTAEQTQPVMADTSTASAGLRENFALLDADMRARGYESFGDRANGQLGQGQSRDFTVSLEGGKCYALLAVGDTSVRDMHLRLTDRGGREVDRDVGNDSRPTVRVCPSSTGNFTLSLQMAAGSGDFIFAGYRWPRGIRGPFGLEGLIYLRLAEVTALLNVEGFSPDPGFTPENGRINRQGQTARHDIDLQAGQCYAVVVVGGDGVRDLDIVLGQGNTQVASDYGSHNAFPSVRHCARQAGRYSLSVTAADGAGPYHYQVFSRQE